MKKMPIVNAMQAYAADCVYPLHTPGHKGGRVINSEFADFMREHFFDLDVSLMAELDSVQAPFGCIAEAHALAAKLYGADITHFAVNGTTGALQSLALGAFNPKDKVLIARNMHCSVMAALILADIQPIFIQTEFLPEFGICVQVTAEQVQAAFDEHPDLKGVMLTSPSYFGIVADVERIAAIVKRHNAILLVDEAHGAHFGFSDKLPQSALKLGADAVVQSTHKSLSALTQTSMLHMKRGRLACDRVSKMFGLLTSTSPNQWLLASLDAARQLMQEHGVELMDRAYTVAANFRGKLQSIEGLRVLDIQNIGCRSAYAQDITKVLVNFRELGYTGIQVGEYLRQHSFEVELVDEYNALFLLTYAEDESKLDEIVELLRSLPRKAKLDLLSLPKAALPERAMSVHNAFYTEHETVEFAQAQGRVMAESIIFYPPGIAHILPGEVLSAVDIDYCQQMAALGVVVAGASDATLQTVRVVKQ